MTVSRLTALGAVWAGGVVGTGARVGLGMAVPMLTFPLVTFVINVAGAFALGVLLEALLSSGIEDGRQTVIRLAVGTGLLGGFTTYSTLAVDTVLLVQSGASVIALGYAGGTVVVGVLAAAGGVRLGRRGRSA
jgi:CrcB protein